MSEPLTSPRHVDNGIPARDMPSPSERATPPSHYLVVDLEATGRARREESEIIEIGAVMVLAADLQPVGEFQTFVRPKMFPGLSAFIRGVTGIRQADVDSAPIFREALHRFGEFFRPFGAEIIFASWGAYDRGQMELDCLRAGVDNPMPANHLNLKNSFAKRQGVRRCGMGTALGLCGVSLVGSHHRGIDDARNIVRLLPWIVGDKRLDAAVSESGKRGRR